VPRSISCCQPATRNRCVGIPHTGSSRRLVESYPPSNVDCTMNAEVDHTIYWGLRALPFNNVPAPRFYVRSSQHDAANRWLSYWIQTRRCLLLLTGDMGCGKTLLSRRLSPTQYDIPLVTAPALSPSELLDEALPQFGFDLVRSKAGRLRTLNERLQSNAQRGTSSVVVVDEAKAIESMKSFKKLLLLTNIQLIDRFLSTVVLIGQPEDRRPCASRPLHGRGDDVVYYGAHGSREPSNRPVCQRRRRSSMGSQRASVDTSMRSVINVSLPERSRRSHRSMTGLCSGSDNLYDGWSNVL
jgi:tRNA A37 threonylcarbamoyladenosine biosynthesis protein TsaE